ncbi:DUF6387 family protein [Escherichia coli]|nr:DUF6387 family protein [Escherichia coli]
MRISHKKDLPTWFDLDNYTQFIGMSDKDLFYQLVVRYDMLENFYRYGGSFYNEPLTNNDEVGRILEMARSLMRLIELRTSMMRLNFLLKEKVFCLVGLRYDQCPLKTLFI